jgi:hypothetical protein
MTGFYLSAAFLVFAIGGGIAGALIERLRHTEEESV